MVLKFKKRSEKDNLKKVLIYGFDGTGKSTFAETYCKENNLTAVVIDIDDTNYTDLPLVEFKRINDVVIYEGLKRIISEMKDDTSFDTIIIDGVSSLLELLVSNSRGMNKYGDRTARWNKLLNLLLNTNKHLIFIGQIDMLVIEGESSKAVINVNSIINEKYRCIYENNKYSYVVEKYRGIEHKDIAGAGANDEFIKANEVPNDKSPARENAEKILDELNVPNLENAKKVLAQKTFEGIYSIDEGNMIWAEIEVLLNGTGG